jgi:RNA polymerase sigma-70 factor, ECF subfamily
LKPAFYERTARPVWAYLARVSGNTGLADDLLQETYLRFLRAKIPNGEVACRQYLFRIASNLLRDHWRRLEPVPLGQLPESTLIAPSNVDDSGMEARRTLASAFPRLRPRDRQLLWLAYAEGASHREIAEITGLRETSIRLLLFRAKRKLARFLGSYQPIRRHEP